MTREEIVRYQEESVKRASMTPVLRDTTYSNLYAARPAFYS